jgi:uncharacterized protein YlxP (DUF503 family)
MPVGLLTLELHIPDAQSLKDKRQVLRSLKDRLRREFNVAVAELDHQDVWQRSVVGVVTLSNEEKHVQQSLQQVLDAADDILGSFLIGQKVEIV